MEEVQRTRILEAMAEMAVDLGAGAVTVSHVVARAGVSRRTFYELFADREACLLAAFDLGVERARARIEPAYAAESRWRDGIRAGLAAFLRFLEDEPALGRLCVVHSLGGGAEVLSRRAEVLRRALGGGRPGTHGRYRGERAAAGADRRGGGRRGPVGDLRPAAGAGANPSDEQPLIELFGVLMNMILLPYLGPSAARRELTRPVPKVRTGAESARAGRGSGDERWGSACQADLPHRARAHRDRRVPGREQPRGGRPRGHRRPGPDLQAARPPAASRPDREHRRAAPRAERRTRGG